MTKIFPYKLFPERSEHDAKCLLQCITLLQHSSKLMFVFPQEICFLFQSSAMTKIILFYQVSANCFKLTLAAFSVLIIESQSGLGRKGP